MNPLPDDVAVSARGLLEAQFEHELSTARLAAPYPEPMSLDEMDALLMVFEDGKQQIVCHPDDYERVSAAVYGSGFGLYYTVVTSLVLDAGQALLFPPRSDVMAVPWPSLAAGGF